MIGAHSLIEACKDGLYYDYIRNLSDEAKAQAEFARNYYEAMKGIRPYPEIPVGMEALAEQVRESVNFGIRIRSEYVRRYD